MSEWNIGKNSSSLLKIVKNYILSYYKLTFVKKTFSFHVVFGSSTLDCSKFNIIYPFYPYTMHFLSFQDTPWRMVLKSRISILLEIFWYNLLHTINLLQKKWYFSTIILKFLDIFSQIALDFMDFMISLLDSLQVLFLITMFTMPQTYEKLWSWKNMHNKKWYPFSKRFKQYILDDTFLQDLILFLQELSYFNSYNQFEKLFE